LTIWHIINTNGIFLFFYFIVVLIKKLLIKNFCHNFHKQLQMKYFSVHLSVFFFFFSQFSISAWRLKWSEHSPLDEPLWVCLLSYFNYGITHKVIQFISSSEKFEVLLFGFVHVIDAKKRGGKETLMPFFFFVTIPCGLLYILILESLNAPCNVNMFFEL
jgi:sensor histidine kinase YesM